jgi:glycosyltransferase involved in cell wall biosynthesis
MTEARHILSFAQTLGGGGVERALLRLAADWVAAGRRVTLVLGETGVPLPLGVETVRVGDRRQRALTLALPAIVRAAAPDILFCPGNHYTSTALWARLRLGRACPPIVAKMSNAVARGDHARWADAAHARWLALHGRFLDHLVAMTPATADQAAAATGMAGRVSIIPNPPAQPMQGAVPVALPPGPVVLGVGRLVAQKRWDRLIDALPRLSHTPSLVILGEGPARESLRTRAGALGLDARVHLPGHAADPLDAMARATVLALASDFEGVPGVLREALSVGTPVVATNASPAVAEIVADRCLGTIVPRGDADALVAALNHWLVPGAPRPQPVPMPGTDSAARYLALFDSLVR